VGLIRLLIILGLIYFSIKFLTRLLLPWLLKTFVKKVEKKMKDHMKDQMNQQDAGSGFEKKEEDVYIKKPQEKQQKSTKDFEGGEYIDFEEIDKK
tara:strand:+ start:275 stop:559 length:285 start_codon:yes stop_codon:yes gene_type:complete